MTNDTANEYEEIENDTPIGDDAPAMPPIMPAPFFEGLAVGGPVDTQGIAGAQGAETETDAEDGAR